MSMDTECARLTKAVSKARSALLLRKPPTSRWSSATLRDENQRHSGRHPFLPIPQRPCKSRRACATYVSSCSSVWKTDRHEHLAVGGLLQLLRVGDERLCPEHGVADHARLSIRPQWLVAAFESMSMSTTSSTMSITYSETGRCCSAGSW
jgi:hypothetical protein